MAKYVKPLSDTEIRRAKPKDKDYKLYDGNGLFLVVRKSGKKVFKVRYRLNSKESEKTLGEYPILSLSAAREKNIEIKKLIFDGIDPNEKKKKDVKKIFDDIADAYFSFKAADLSENYLKKQKSRYEYFIRKEIGYKIADDITKKDIIECINNIPNAKTRSTKNTDLRETKRIILILIETIFKYGNANDLMNNSEYLKLDKTTLIPKKKPIHFKSITDIEELRKIYKLINEYQGDISTKYALLFLIHTALRTINVRFLTWDHIDFKNRVIEFSAKEMKAREPFRIPITDFVYDVLKEVEGYNGGYKYVFSSVLSKNKMLSENTLGYALKRMEIFSTTPHGFRSSFSTICYDKQREHGFMSEVIESQLAHRIGDDTKLAYMRSDFLEDRRELCEWWDKLLTQ